MTTIETIHGHDYVILKNNYRTLAAFKISVKSGALRRVADLAEIEVTQ
jgi:hypothetical protein